MEQLQPLPFWFKIDTGGGSVQSMIYIPDFDEGDENHQQLIADWLAHIPSPPNPLESSETGGGEDS